MIQVRNDGIRLVPWGTADHSKCRHFNGTINKKCEAGIEYDSVKVRHEPISYIHSREASRANPTVYSMSGSMPCSERYNLGGAKCEKYSPPTAEEIEEKQAQWKRTSDLMARGLSSCCEAPIDNSHVIAEGRHKGHGSRYCSKCGRCVFIV